MKWLGYLHLMQLSYGGILIYHISICILFIHSVLCPFSPSFPTFFKIFFFNDSILSSLLAYLIIPLLHFFLVVAQGFTMYILNL